MPPPQEKVVTPTLNTDTRCCTGGGELCEVDPGLLLLETVNRHFQGSYSCSATTRAGRATASSNTVTLRVTYPPGQMGTVFTECPTMITQEARASPGQGPGLCTGGRWWSWGARWPARAATQPTLATPGGCRGNTWTRRRGPASAWTLHLATTWARRCR